MSCFYLWMFESLANLNVTSFDGVYGVFDDVLPPNFQVKLLHYLV